MVESIFAYAGVFGLTIFNSIIIHNGKIRIKGSSGRGSFIGWILRFAFIFYPLILFYGFRDHVGTDYQAYLSYYKYLRGNMTIENILHTYMEPGYVFLNVIADALFEDNFGIFMVSGIVLFGFLYMILSKYKKHINVPMAIFIYCMVCYSFACNGIRQSLAAVLVLYAYTYMVERKFWKFLFCLIVASLFHTSAILCVVFYLFVYIKPHAQKLVKILLVGGGMFVLLLQRQIVAVLGTLSLYSAYSTWTGSGFVSGVSFMLYVVPTLALIEIYKGELIKQNPRYETYITLLYVQIPFQCLGVFNSVMERMAVYCSIVEVIVIPLIYRAITNRKNKASAMLIITGWFIVYFVIMNIVLGGNDVFPYHFWNFADSQF